MPLLSGKLSDRWRTDTHLRWWIMGALLGSSARGRHHRHPREQRQASVMMLDSGATEQDLTPWVCFPYSSAPCDRFFKSEFIPGMPEPIGKRGRVTWRQTGREAANGAGGA